jgi:hypothetical protein
LRASIDNVDAKVDTADGRNSFHGTACSVYQPVPPNATINTLCEPLSLGDSTSCSKGLGNVPSTVISLHPCSIIGSPKPCRSPRYEHYRLGQHQHEVDSAKQHDFIWMLARYLQRPRAEHQEQELTVTQEEESLNAVDQGENSEPLIVVGTSSHERQGANLQEENLNVIDHEEGSVSLCNANTLSHQAVPVWRAYNSMLYPNSG